MLGPDTHEPGFLKGFFKEYNRVVVFKGCLGITSHLEGMYLHNLARCPMQVLALIFLNMAL
jgi:hypothetical protein